jgi:hypothetical protein
MKTEQNEALTCYSGVMRDFFLGIAMVMILTEARAEPTIHGTGMFEPKFFVKQKLQKKPHHCTQGEDESSLSAHAFEVSILCSRACSDTPGEEREFRSTARFDPEEQGLMAGDGHHPPEHILPSSFGSIFSAWAERQCLDGAKSACGGLSKITQARMLKAESGNWSLTERLHCGKDAPVVHSPFDKKFTLKRSSPLGIPLRPSLGNPKFPKPLFPGTFKEPPLCSHRISGRSCFGDCILLDHSDHKDIPLTLMTPEASAFDDKSICADDLIKKFSSQRPSPVAAETLCREYFARQLLYTKSFGTSCAAFRTEPDCKAVVKALVGSP